VEVAPVTLETFDPLVVQVEAAIAIVTFSTGLVPPFCNGGSNVTLPVPEQVMPPVATFGALVDELVDVDLLVVDVELLVVDVELLVVDVELLVVDVELLGLEEHAASPSDRAKPTRRSLGMRQTARTTIDTGPATEFAMWQRMHGAHCSV
jgi:hypothetical protein